MRSAIFKKMKNLKIRKIEKRDLNILSKIYAETYKYLDVGEKWNKKSSYKLLSYWLKRQPDLCFLAEYNKKIIGGFVSGIKPWWDGNHLVDGEIFLHPDYQKRGIGTELSKFLYNLALKKYNVIRFDAFTFKKTKFPLIWYKKQGFKEIKEWTIISGKLKDILNNLNKN